MILYGTNTFGGTDEVDDLFKVKTQFFHVWFVPLIPIGSYLVVDDSIGSFNGIKIPFSVKSLLVAWGRTACFFGSILSLIGMASNTGNLTSTIVCIVLAALCIAMLIASYAVPAITHASYQRAIELVNVAGIGPQMTPIVNQVFGKGSTGHDMNWAQQQVAETFHDVVDPMNAGHPSSHSGSAPGQQPQPLYGAQGQPSTAGHWGAAPQPYGQPQPHGGQQYGQHVQPHGQVGAQTAPLDNPGTVRWGMVTGIAVAGVVGLLLCGGIFAVAFTFIPGGAAEQVEPFAQNNDGAPAVPAPPGFPVQPPVFGNDNPDQGGRNNGRPRGNGNNASPPITIDDAIAMVVDGDELDRNKGYSFLTVENNVDMRRRREVAEALTTVPSGEDTIPYQGLLGLKLWAGEENIPALIEAARVSAQIGDGIRGMALLDIFLNLNDPLVAEGLAFVLDDRRAKEALAGFGPSCADHVIPYINSADYSTRNNARELVMESWTVDQSKVIEQCLADLESDDPGIIEASAELLKKGEFADHYKPQLAAAFEQIVLTGDERSARDAISTLGNIGRKPESAQAIMQAMEMFPDAKQLHSDAIDAFGQLKSEEAIPVIVAALDGGNSYKVKDALINIGTPSAVEGVAPWFNSKDYSACNAARDVVKAIGGDLAPIYAQCAADLKGDDVKKLHKACDWLKEQPLDTDHKSAVAEGLTAALGKLLVAGDAGA